MHLLNLPQHQSVQKINCLSKCQNGSLLFEFLIIASLALVLTIWGVNEWTQKSKDLQAKSLANWMQIASRSVGAYMQDNYESLQSRLKANPSDNQIDWQVLQTAGYLPVSWQKIGPSKQTLGLRVDLIGDCALQACYLRAIVYTKKPVLTAASKLDESFIAQWLMTMGGTGAVVWPAQADFISGYGVKVRIPNDLILPIGTIATVQSTRTNQADSGESAPVTEDFLKVKDPRNPDFQGDLNVAGDIISAKNLIAENGVVINKYVIENGSCPTEGAISHNYYYAGLMVCKNGKWQFSAPLKGGGYLFNSKRGCVNSLGQSTANPITNSCSCPPLYKDIQISESGSLTDPGGQTYGYICQFL